MPEPTKILIIFGTRPEAIKLFPVIRALAADPRFNPVVCVSAQHRQMLDQVLEIAGVTPDHDLDLMQPDQTLDGLTAALLTRLGEVMDHEQPARVMVQGDTATAIEHFTALTDHAPDFAEGWNARATAYFQAGEFGPSVNDIAKTLTLNPRHFGALSGLGMIFEQLDQPEKALEAYKAALAIHPHLQGVIEAVERLEADTAGTDL
mgnify:CR=1 FL=1